MTRKHTKRGRKKNKRETKKKVKKSQSHKLKPQPLRCAPGRQHRFTCYNSDALHDLKTAWNQKYPQNQIPSNDPHDIWIFLNTQLKHLCKDEKCWLEQAFMYRNKNVNLSK